MEFSDQMILTNKLITGNNNSLIIPASFSPAPYLLPMLLLNNNSNNDNGRDETKSEGTNIQLQDILKVISIFYLNFYLMFP